MDELAFIEWNIEQTKHILEVYKDSPLMLKSYSIRLEELEKKREKLLRDK